MTLRSTSEAIDTAPCECTACSDEDFRPGRCADAVRGQAIGPWTALVDQLVTDIESLPLGDDLRIQSLVALNALRLDPAATGLTGVHEDFSIAEEFAERLGEDLCEPSFLRPQALILLDQVEQVVRAADPKSWWEGPTFSSPDGSCHCVLAHVFHALGEQALSDFENDWSTSYVIGACVNDRATADYPQAHPAQRVLAYLSDLRSGRAVDVVTSSELQYCANRLAGED